ncbi:unnamed protein product [Dracunculus medinensis]|uniref:IMD domain-containing protein n=1 Tax=Dracunculus medinensis TaxID=318479 RepID=A0A0N4U762_DRAME|nr:unnamed protein product [Dracunculus medinensis]
MQAGTTYTERHNQVASTGTSALEYQKEGIYQGLKEELEMWKVKAKAIPEIIGALGTPIPKLENIFKRFQKTTSKIHPDEEKEHSRYYAESLRPLA